ncbi:MAG TPA: Asp-tRNA(Asn)/Glu-tRNA(Gln) amidotransferase GatCAB subunit B, partial [Anaerolineae bacterium]
IDPVQIPELIALVSAGTISNTIAKTVFGEMFVTGRAPRAIVQEKGLAQISDRGALVGIVDKVLADNPQPVAEFIAGKETIAKFLVGQVMKATRGQGNPALVNELVIERLKAQRS